MKSIIVPQDPGLIIHVEGPDGSGKSTLAKTLSKIRGLTLIPTQNPPKSAEDCISRIAERVRPNIVCDRSSGLISELVYGPVLRGSTIVPEETLWGIVSRIMSAVTFVYCTADGGDEVMTVRDDEDPEHIEAVRKCHAALAERYRVVFERLEYMNARIRTYNWRKETAEEFSRCAVL